MTASEQCDKMLNELSLLTYGLPYSVLTPLQADKVISEAVGHFDPRLVDLADSLS